MNRQQRRHPKNKNKDILSKVIAMDKILKSTPNDIKEGQAVKLDYNKIKSHPDYNRLQEKYKKYIEDYKDEIMRIKFDEKYSNHTIVALVDKNGKESVWRFVISDLEIIEE